MTTFVLVSARPNLELVGHLLLDLVRVLGVSPRQALVLLLHHRPLLHHLQMSSLLVFNRVYSLEIQSVHSSIT